MVWWIVSKKLKENKLFVNYVLRILVNAVAMLDLVIMIVELRSLVLVLAEFGIVKQILAKAFNNINLRKYSRNGIFLFLMHKSIDFKHNIYYNLVVLLV